MMPQSVYVAVVAFVPSFAAHNVAARQACPPRTWLGSWQEGWTTAVVKVGFRTGTPSQAQESGAAAAELGAGEYADAVLGALTRFDREPRVPLALAKGKGAL